MSEPHFWDESIKKYSRYRSVGVRALSDEINKLIKKSKFSDLDKMLNSSLKSKKVLDAGCGTGIYVEYLIQREAEVFATDFSRKAIKYVNKFIPKTYLIVSDVSNLPFIDESFDVIVCLSVLYHIVDDEKWQKALTDFSELLKEKGLLILQIEWSAETKEYYKYYKARSKIEYFRQFENLGFKILEVKPILNLSNAGKLLHRMGRKTIPIIANFLILKLDLFSKTTSNVLLLLRKI